MDDSDLEILDEVEGPGPNACEDEDELLDLDDDDIVPFPGGGDGGFRSSGTSRNGAKVVCNSKRKNLAREDEDHSLPSISPPPQSQSPSDYDNGEGFEFEVETVPDKRDKDLKGVSGSNSKAKPKEGSSKKSSFEEVDEFLRETEYSSLADYLAEVEGRKNPQRSKVTASSRPHASSSNSASSSAVNSQQSHPTSSSSTKQSKSPNSSFEEQVKAFEGKNKRKTNNAQAINRLSKKGKKAAANDQPSESGNPQRVRVKTGDFRNMIVLHIPEEILSDQLASKLIDNELRFQIVETPVLENAILYEHQVKYKMVGKDFQVEEKVVKEMDENIFIIFPIDKNLSVLQNEIELSNSGVSSPSPSGYGNSETVTTWMKNIQSKHQGKKFTLLIQGLEAYLKKGQRAAQKEYRDRILQAGQAENGAKKKRTNLKQKNSIKLNRHEIQNALIRLQLFTDINYRFYESVSDLATHFYHYTKAIAEAIQEKEKDKMNPTGFDWYAVADSTGGIPVEENGKGMTSLWVSQLCQFPSIGQEKALAITRAYPSPRALYKAYKRCSSVEEGLKLLEDIQVTVGIGPYAKKQRLGPEISKRVCRFFTATDGKLEIH